MTDKTKAFKPEDHLSEARKGGGKDYLQVKWRMVWFRSVYPHGSITSWPVKVEDHVAVFGAKAVAAERRESDGYLVLLGEATGHGSETPNDFRDYIEKAETKAIGRALAALGFGTQFAPELDEEDRIVDTPTPRQPARQAPQPQYQDHGPDEDDQWASASRYFHTLLTKHGVSEELKRSFIRFGGIKSGSAKDMTAKQLRDACNWMGQQPDVLQAFQEVADAQAEEEAKQAELMPTEKELRNAN